LYRPMRKASLDCFPAISVFQSPRMVVWNPEAVNRSDKLRLAVEIRGFEFFKVNLH